MWPARRRHCAFCWGTAGTKPTSPSFTIPPEHQILQINLAHNDILKDNIKGNRAFIPFESKMYLLFSCPGAVPLCYPENPTDWFLDSCPAAFAWLDRDQRPLHKTAFGGCQTERKMGCEEHWISQLCSKQHLWQAFGLKHNRNVICLKLVPYYMLWWKQPPKEAFHNML